MANYKTPGVYIEEISTLPASVAPVATAVPAFIGYTEKTIVDNVTIDPSTDRIPVRITSMLDFIDHFGGPFKEYFSVAVSDPAAGETEATIAVAGIGTDQTPYSLYYQVKMFYANGGGNCYIVSVGNYTAIDETDATTIAADIDAITIDDAALDAGLTVCEEIDEITILTIPEAISVSDADRKTLYDNMLTQCNKLQDRFAVMDVEADAASTVFNDGNNFRNDNVGSDNLKYGAAYYPSMETLIEYAFDETKVRITDTTTGTNAAIWNDKFLISISTGLELDGVTPIPGDGGVAQYVDTTLYNRIKKELQKYKVTLYPCGAVAGIYASVDRDRGVWKAPANVSVNMILEPSIAVTSAEQEDLNVDATTGKSINAIRLFSGKGSLVWGSRTLAGNDNEWRYVPVRRFFNFMEESIKKATEFVIFEPNSKPTWVRTKAMIENFLTQLWRDGALAGAKPEHAFFVKVGLGETMTAIDILEGRMNIEIGVAAVRPAEFIILKFSHKLQES